MSLDINWLAVLASAVAAFVLGGVWYGPLFERTWRAAEGTAEPQTGRQKHPAFVYGLAFALMLIAAAALAIAIGPDPSVAKSVGFALIVGVGWVATSFGVNYLFAGRRLVLLALDAGYNVVSFALMGLIIGLFG